MKIGNTRIASVISFCTHDYRYLRACIEGVAPFSDQIFISVCDHFFNGQPENYALLERAYEEFPNCKFIEFAFDPNATYNQFSTADSSDPDWVHYWHGTSRLIPFYFLDPSIEYVLFADVDEIVETKRFVEWLERFPYREFEALRFSSYYYFREARFQATEYPAASLLVRRESLRPDIIMNPDERSGMLWRMKGRTRAEVMCLNDKPMFHHYSWVRTKEEIMCKIQSWGHARERDWVKIFHEELNRTFQGVDCVRGYPYKEVESVYDPLVIQIPDIYSCDLEEHLSALKKYPNIERVDRKKVFWLDLGWNCLI